MYIFAHMDKNDYLLLGKRNFFYVEICDKYKKRNDILSDILEDEEVIKTYHTHQGKLTTELHLARFHKDRLSCSRQYNIGNASYEILSMKPRDFIKLMEEVSLHKEHEELLHNHIYAKNIKFLKEEKKIQSKIKLLRNNYITSSESYRAVPSNKYDKLLNCPVCKLKPLVWEFDNGRLTSCGCGKNKYDHFTIRAESIMSHITRHDGSAHNYRFDELINNWNHWVKTGEILFDPKKNDNDKNKW